MTKLTWKDKDGKGQCMHCTGCIAVCPTEALKFNGNKLIWDEKKCNRCMKCAESCPEKVISFK